MACSGITLPFLPLRKQEQMQFFPIFISQRYRKLLLRPQKLKLPTRTSILFGSPIIMQCDSVLNSAGVNHVVGTLELLMMGI
jgi:hypothetical protein